MGFRRMLCGAVGLCLALPLIGACGSAPIAQAAQDMRLQGEERPKLDVPYVPTRHAVVEKMLEMADVGPDDYVIDLGSGDGRILVAAARTRGASGFGVDIDPVRVREADANARQAGVEGRVSFRQQDLFETPIAEATVLTMYLLPEVNLRLRPRILEELRPGTRVVSHAFDMGEWQPDATAEIDLATVYLWIVPAQAAGEWTLRDASGNARLSLNQNFQELRGTLRRGSRSIAIEDARLHGEKIRFTAEGRTYEGTVHEGTMKGAGWQATRASGH